MRKRAGPEERADAGLEKEVGLEGKLISRELVWGRELISRRGLVQGRELISGRELVRGRETDSERELTSGKEPMPFSHCSAL